MKKKTVLIANECKETANSLRHLFLQENFDVLSEDNGIDTVKRVMLLLPEIVILSDSLPLMNGYHVCRFLKNSSTTQSIFIIVLTSVKDPQKKCVNANNCTACVILNGNDQKKIVAEVMHKFDESALVHAYDKGVNKISTVEVEDIISGLNNILDKKSSEVYMFRALTGLVQNVFSSDDLALAVLDIFQEIINYSVAIIVVVEERESNIVMHLHNNISKEEFARIKDSCIADFNDTLRGFRGTKLHINVLGENNVLDNKCGENVPAPVEVVYSRILDNAILKKGFVIYGNSTCQLDKSHGDLLRDVINEACVIIETSWLYNRLYKNVKNLAITDSLTSIYNHKYILRLVYQEFSRSKRYNHPISVIMFDVDHFKKINDNYGHQIGDEVLKEIGSLTSNTKRNSDEVGRYGGEEFLILLPETDTKEALLFANRLRKKIEEYAFFSMTTSVKITVSMGVATCPAINANGPHSFIKCADMALYQAKEQGRNRVCVFSDEF